MSTAKIFKEDLLIWKCRGCERDLERDKFYATQTRCKECCDKKTKEYYIKHPEASYKATKKWRKKKRILKHINKALELLGEA